MRPGIDALLILTFETRIFRVHVDAKSAAVQLGGTNFDQFQQLEIDAVAAHNTFHLQHGFIGFRRSLQCSPDELPLLSFPPETYDSVLIIRIQFAAARRKDPRREIFLENVLASSFL